MSTPNKSAMYTFHVSGTHCAACKHLIEELLGELTDVNSAVVSLREETVTITTSAVDEPPALITRYNDVLITNGYRLSRDKPEAVPSSTVRSDWLIALPVVAILLLGYVALERSGFTGLTGLSDSMFVTAFLVGLVASVSTCLAVVGGLVLSVSATYAHEGRGWRPQAWFHVGRFLGFFLLGGLLGVLGEVMQIGIYGSAVLGIIASVVMLVLGIHLLDVTKRVRAFTLPSGLSRALTSFAHKAGTIAPVLLGMVTFFLPCGFTQSMQIVALSSGDFLTASLIMTLFALGTFPVLALLSFGSLDLAKTRYRGVFFKSAGLLVILFALFNLHNALVLFGIITPLIGF